MMSRRARGGVSLFFLVVALPVALVGLSLSSEWAAILLARRQASMLAEAAASASASATYADDPTRIDPAAAQPAAAGVLAEALKPSSYSGGTTRMISPARGVEPTVSVQVDPSETVVQVTVEFTLPSYPVLDLVSVVFGGGRYELSGSATAAAAICFPGLEQNTAGCRVLQVG